VRHPMAECQLFKHLLAEDAKEMMQEDVRRSEA